MEIGAFAEMRTDFDILSKVADMQMAAVLAAEVGRGVTGMSRREANDIVVKRIESMRIS